jgi:cytochrome P450
MATIDHVARTTVPHDIARAIMLPESYADLEGTVHPACKWLRENAPIGRAELEGYDPIWIIAKHAELKTVLRDPETFHNADVNIMLQPQAGDAYLRSLLGGNTHVLDNLSFMEPPRHTDHRQAIAKSFLPAQIRGFEARFREIAKENVDRLMEHGGEADFVELLAFPYPMNAILEMLGVPPEDYDYMLKLTQEAFGGDDPDSKREEIPQTPEAMARQWKESVADFYRYFDKIRRDRHAHPRDDLATALVTARLENGELQSERVQNDALCAIGVAGHDTTSSAISAGMHGLASFPEQFEKVKADLTLVPGLVEESLRWGTPARHFMRNATRDTELSGVAIKKMDRLMCLFLSGNYDEEVFPDPYQFDLTRRPNSHLAFSFGVHSCIGQHIAKLEMRVLWQELLPRLDSIELAGEPTLRRANWVGGFKSLPIRFTKV